VYEVQGDKVTTARNIGEVDESLDAESRGCRPSFPIIATIACPGGFEVHIGLGDPESLVLIYLPRSERGGTYYISIGSRDRHGTKRFWLHNAGDTDFETQHLIPADVARTVVRQFLATGNRSTVIGWEESYY
jgi:hypothetical protein